MKTEKRSSPKKEHFFSRIPVETCASDAHQSQTIGGMQTILKLLGGYTPPPRVSAPLVGNADQLSSHLRLVVVAAKVLTCQYQSGCLEESFIVP